MNDETPEYPVKDQLAAGPAHPGRLKMLALVAGGLFLFVAAFILLQDRQETTPSPGKTEQAAKDASAQTVQVMKPLRRDMVQTLSLPANISPWYQTTLYAKVPGYLKSVRVDKGDRVKQGQLLAVIDAPEIRDQFEQAESDHAIKKLTFERLEGVWKEKPDVIARQDVDVAQAAAESAKQMMDNRRAMLDYTKVTAPFTGIITARFVDPGAMIQAATGSATGAVPLLTIMDMDTVRVYASVPQEAALLAKPGIPVVLTVKELPDRPFKGSISRTTEALDPATRTLLIEIDLPNKEHLLQPGTFADATLYLQHHENALAIPPAAIVPGADGKTKSVFVIEQNKARLVPVKTGIDDGLFLEVVAGLTGNEDVVVVGKGNLADGQPVRASPYNLPTGTPSSQKM